MQNLVAVTTFVFLAACGSSTTQDDLGGRDLSASGADLVCVQPTGKLPFSACGQPCDVGNSMGVGKYCKTSDDCKGNGMAVTCSSILNAGDSTDTYFCTIPLPTCETSACGDHAECYTVPNKGTGCTPYRCIPGLE